MTTYVALLRGINVGGHHQVPMAELRAACDAIGLRDVATYIQSGNVVFTSPSSERELVSTLAAGLADRFGFTIPVIVRDAAALAAAAEAHPLSPLDIEEKLLHVAFMAEAPDAEAISGFDLTRYAPDDVVVRGREAYIAYPNGSGRSKLTLDVIERALGTTGTARNWRTVQKLVALATDAGSGG